MVGHLADLITYAKFQDEVTTLQGVEFPIFPIDFAWALQQCSATALPVIGDAPRGLQLSTISDKSLQFRFQISTYHIEPFWMYAIFSEVGVPTKFRVAGQ